MQFKKFYSEMITNSFVELKYIKSLLGVLQKKFLLSSRVL